MHCNIISEHLNCIFTFTSQQPFMQCTSMKALIWQRCRVLLYLNQSAWALPWTQKLVVLQLLTTAITSIQISNVNSNVCIFTPTIKDLTFWFTVFTSLFLLFCLQFFLLLLAALCKHKGLQRQWSFQSYTSWNIAAHNVAIITTNIWYKSTTMQCVKIKLHLPCK